VRLVRAVLAPQAHHRPGVVLEGTLDTGLPAPQGHARAGRGCLSVGREGAFLSVEPGDRVHTPQREAPSEGLATEPLEQLGRHRLHVLAHLPSAMSMTTGAGGDHGIAKL
jgi:hypothetical protein